MTLTSTAIEPPGWGYATTHYRTLLWRVTPGIAGWRERAIVGPGVDFLPIDLEPGPDGSAWMLAWSSSPDLPIVDAWQPTLSGGTDFVVARYAALEEAPIFLTYLGGTSWEGEGHLSVTEEGDGVMLGSSVSSDYPTVRAFQRAPGGYSDAVITRIDGSGRVSYSSFVGGSSWETASSVGLDREGNGYLAGYTYSADFPLTLPRPPAGISKSSVFLAALDHDGRPLFSSILDWGAAAVDETSLNAAVRGMAPQPNGSLVAVVGYHGNDWLRDGAFVAVVDRWGRQLRPPAAVAVEGAPNFYLPGAVATRRHLALVLSATNPDDGSAHWFLKRLPFRDLLKE